MFHLPSHQLEMEEAVFVHLGLGRLLQEDLQEKHLEVDFLLDQVEQRLFCLEVQVDVKVGLRTVGDGVDLIEEEELDEMMEVDGKIVVAVAVAVGTSRIGDFDRLTMQFDKSLVRSHHKESPCT
jgi:hypothetical protein